MRKIYNLILPLILSLIIVSFTFLIGKNYGEIKLGDEILKRIPNSEDVSKDFKVYTRAVCSNGSNAIKCTDELFVMCNDVEHNIPNNAMGLATLPSNWTDLR